MHAYIRNNYSRIYHTCVALHTLLSNSYVPTPHPRPGRAPSRPLAPGSGSTKNRGGGGKVGVREGG